MRQLAEEIVGLNVITGEITTFPERTYITTPEEIRKKKEAYLKSNQIAMIKDEYKQNGTFVWQLYQIAEPYDTELAPSTLTRLIYLSTYLGYSGYLVADTGKTVKSEDGKAKIEKIPLDKKDIRRALDVSDREFNNFMAETQELKILKFKDDCWYIDSKLFRRGSIPNQKLACLAEKGIMIMRMYRNSIRSLYESATTRSHKTLSYIFQIMPFVNREYNIVCHNPLETDLNKIRNMTLGEFCKIINYDETHSTRLFNTLFKPQFKTKDGELKTAIRCVASKGADKSKYSIFINPKVYYAGDRWEEVKVLGEF